MATVYWEGGAEAVKQVGTFQITADDATTTYKITIGDQVVSVSGSGTGVNDTATALQVALEASTHAYFTNIDWTVATDTITATAGTAGAPFTATSSVAGGTGTIGAYSATTANAGPNDWSTTDNWSSGTVPVSSDTVIIADNSDNICWGLAQSAVDLAVLNIRRTYTGKIGHNYQNFATSANGATVVSGTPEYRDTYLAISATDCRVGEHNGAGSPSGSTRILLDLGTTASTVLVLATANTSAETGRAALRLKAAHASTTIHVRGAVGGVSVAAGQPGETSTISKASIGYASGASTLHIESGTTVTTLEALSGTLTASAAADVTTVTVDGGTVSTYGDFKITTATIKDGTFRPAHVKTGGVEIATLNIDGGTVDVQADSQSRTFTTVNWEGGSLKAKDDLTITTLNEPTGKAYTLTVS